MSDFAAIVADVYTCTNRNDLVAETDMAVKSATLQCHRADLFAKDLYETGIAFTTSEYVQQLEYRLVIPRWRQIKYLRKWDNNNGRAGQFLTAVPTEKVIDGYGVERTNIYYLAGAVYQIKSSTQEQYYILGAYVNPDVSGAFYSSWIADEYPNAIMYRAASIVCKQIHQDDLATKYDQLAALELQEVVMANIETVSS